MKPDFEKWCKVKYNNNPLILNDIFANGIIPDTEDLNQFAEEYAEKEYNRGYKAGRKFKSKEKPEKELIVPDWIKKHNRQF